MMNMPAQCAVDQPVAVLNIEGQAIDQLLLLIAWGNEVKAILIFACSMTSSKEREVRFSRSHTMQAKYDAGVTVAENFHAGYFGVCMSARSMGMIRALPCTYRS